MNLKMNLSRPVAATLLLGALLGAAGLMLSALLVDLSAAYAERSAKDEFIARAPAASATGKRFRQDKAASPYVEAETETLAAAQVDGLVRSTVLEAGGTVSSSRAEAAHDEGGLPGKIEEEAEIGGSTEALQAILFKLETGAPMMLVDTLTVQPAAAGVDDNASAPSLRATVKLAAYWKGKGR